MIGLMKEISEFKIEGHVERVLDKFERIIVKTKKLDLTQNIDFAMKLQFIERMEKSGKISSEERYRLKNVIEIKDGVQKLEMWQRE